MRSITVGPRKIARSLAHVSPSCSPPRIQHQILVFHITPVASLPFFSLPSSLNLKTHDPIGQIFNFENGNFPYLKSHHFFFTRGPSLCGRRFIRCAETGSPVCIMPKKSTNYISKELRKKKKEPWMWWQFWEWSQHGKLWVWLLSLSLSLWKGW